MNVSNLPKVTAKKWHMSHSNLGLTPRPEPQATMLVCLRGWAEMRSPRLGRAPSRSVACVCVKSSHQRAERVWRLTFPSEA